MRPDEPSATSRMVARGIAYVSGDPRWRHLVPSRAAEINRALLLGCFPGERRTLALLDRPGFRGLVAFTEGLVSPGILLHYALRKRYLEEVAREALEQGFRQVVVFGAGLDTLALRLHGEYPDRLFIEVDHPATQRCKRPFLDAAGPNLRYAAADLANGRLSDILRAGCPSFNPAADTLFLAEGLLMYFPPWRAGTLIGGVRDALLPGARCRVAFTFVETQLDGRPDFPHGSHALRLWLRLRGEPFRWGVHRDDLSAQLRHRGFTCHEIVSPDGLLRRYSPGGMESDPPSPVNGDLICVADRFAI